MRGNNNVRLWVRTLLLKCVVLSLASLGGTLLQLQSQRVSREQPLSRREITAYGIPRDAVATRGQSFSLKLCKDQRPQFDQAIAGNAPKLYLPAARVALVLTMATGHPSAPVSLPTGRAPPRLA